MVTAEQIHKEFKADLMGDITPEERNTLNLIGYGEVGSNELQDKFRLNKIISLNKAVVICDKYNLRMCNMRDFVGSIPQKNVKEINEFVKNHMLYRVSYYQHNFFGSDFRYEIIKPDRLEEVKKDKNFRYAEPNMEFYICAPEDMVVTREKRDKVGAMSPDPVILAEYSEFSEDGDGDSVRHRDKRIIVTAWGIEASDPSVVNHNNN